MSEIATKGPTSGTGELICVTGASGFLGLHCVVQALQRGYAVRGTIRTPSREPSLRAAIADYVEPEAMSQLSFVTADLSAEAGWTEATAGVKFVLHVASPFPPAKPKHEDELIAPAKEGTLRVLAAAAKAGVERVVLTSSCAAVFVGHTRDGSRVFDETDWSQIDGPVDAYPKSKTIAEQSAWAFAEAHPETQLVVINPGLILGPMIAPVLSTSLDVVRKYLNGSLPGCPDLHLCTVDVRDVAAAHLDALTVPAAAGHRFIVANPACSMRDVALVLRDAYGHRGYTIATRKVPSWLIRLVALWDKSTGLIVAELGKTADVSCARAEAILGFESRSLKEMVVDTAESLIRHELVK